MPHSSRTAKTMSVVTHTQPQVQSRGRRPCAVLSHHADNEAEDPYRRTIDQTGTQVLRQCLQSTGHNVGCCLCLMRSQRQPTYFPQRGEVFAAVDPAPFQAPLHSKREPAGWAKRAASQRISRENKDSASRVRGKTLFDGELWERKRPVDPSLASSHLSLEGRKSAKCADETSALSPPPRPPHPRA